VPLAGEAQETTLDGIIHHQGGPFRLLVTAAAGTGALVGRETKGPPGATLPPAVIWIGSAAVTRT